MDFRVRVRNGLLVSSVILGSLLCGAGAGWADDEPWLVHELTVASMQASLEDRDYASRYRASLVARQAERQAALQEALEAAQALDSLVDVVDLGDGSGVGVYDVRGLWDPFGETDGAPEQDPALGQFSLLYALGRVTPGDPMDLGLPGSTGRSSVFAPDVGGAIEGVAGRLTRRHRFFHTEIGWVDQTIVKSDNGTTTTLETFFMNDGHVVSLSRVSDPQGVVNSSTIEQNEAGRVTYHEVYRRGYGRDMTTYDEDGRSDTHHEPDGRTSQPDDDSSGEEPAEDTTTELKNPDDAGAGVCLLPWQCDEETPQETMARWTVGATQVLTMQGYADPPLDRVPPIVTLFDLLHNPGYIDGLFILDEGSVERSSVPLDNPEVQY